MEDFLKLLDFESKEINHLFDKASIEGKGTPQEISDRRELAVKKFLERYFPFPHRIAKGNIIDSFGVRSASIDCILLSPSHPYTVTDEEKYSVIFADGVDAAIEVKPDLANKHEIKRALEQIATVKKLRRKRHGLLLTSKYTPEQIELAKTIPTFIFGNKTYKDIRNLVEQIVIYYEENKTPKSQQFDFIVINGIGMVFNSTKNGYFNVGSGLEGIVFEIMNEKTIAAFLYWLNYLPKSEPTIGPSVLSQYIKFKPEQMQTYHDLNLRLSQIKVSD